MRYSTGQAQLREVSIALKAAGSPRGMRAKVRKGIVAASGPLKAEVKRNALAIPAKGPATTGLRKSLSKAVRVSVLLSSRNVGVRLMVDGKKMPIGQQSLPTNVEGQRVRWRHPVFGDREVWRNQASHPIVAPAIPKHAVQFNGACEAAVAATLYELSKG